MTTSETNRIHERIDEFRKEFGKEMSELTGAVRSMEASCKPCREKVVRLDTAIYGNGSDGLRVDVAGHSKAIREMTGTRKRAVRDGLKFMAGLLTIVAAVLATKYFG